MVVFLVPLALASFAGWFFDLINSSVIQNNHQFKQQFVDLTQLCAVARWVTS